MSHCSSVSCYFTLSYKQNLPLLHFLWTVLFSFSSLAHRITPAGLCLTTIYISPEVVLRTWHLDRICDIVHLCSLGLHLIPTVVGLYFHFGIPNATFVCDAVIKHFLLLMWSPHLERTSWLFMRPLLISRHLHLRCWNFLWTLETLSSNTDKTHQALCHCEMSSMKFYSMVVCKSLESIFGLIIFLSAVLLTNLIPIV